LAGPAIAALARAREHVEILGLPFEDLDIKDGATAWMSASSSARRFGRALGDRESI